VGRKRSQRAPKKKKGGVLMGMRGTVQRAAKAVSTSTADPAKKRSNLIWNIITVIAVAVTAVILLRRFGVLDF
jgi:hypothetical protein